MKGTTYIARNLDGTDGNYFKGSIKEILIFNRFLNDQERFNINFYLSEKWNMKFLVDSDGDELIDVNDSEPVNQNPIDGYWEVNSGTDVNGWIYISSNNVWSSCEQKILGQYGPTAGTQTKTRTCVQPKYGGVECSGSSSLSQDCNIPKHGVWGAWSDWSSKTVRCGSGTITRSRTCSEPLYGGNECTKTNNTLTSVGDRVETESEAYTQYLDPVNGYRYWSAHCVNIWYSKIVQWTSIEVREQCGGVRAPSVNPLTRWEDGNNWTHAANQGEMFRVEGPAKIKYGDEYDSDHG